MKQGGQNMAAFTLIMTPWFFFAEKLYGDSQCVHTFRHTPGVHLCVRRHGKSRKDASIAWRKVLRKLWIFLDKPPFFWHFYPSMAKIYLFEGMQFTRNNCNLGNFYMIRKYVICGHFSIWKICLRTKIMFSMSVCARIYLVDLYYLVNLSSNFIKIEAFVVEIFSKQYWRFFHP